MRELWHAAGKAAGDSAKRRVALVGLLMSAPALVLGALLFQLPSGRGSADITEPLAYVLEPLTRAYWADADAALLGYVLVQALLLALVWSFYGTTIQRLAAVELTQGRREETDGAYRFAVRHWRGVLGAKLALLLAAAVPLLLAWGLAHLGRLDGWMGGVLLAVAIVIAAVAAFLAVLLFLSWCMGGFLSTSVIATEDSGSFDALARSFGYAGAGLPRLVLWRLAFLGGVLLGSAWRALRAVLILGLAYLILRAGAGVEAVDRIERILQGAGTPMGAERLDLGWSDYVAACAAGLVLFWFTATWLADLVARVCCARAGIYLALRGAIDKLPREHLASAPEAPPFQDAEAAGFVEVARVGDDA